MNLASRIASHATAGQVLASEDAVRRADAPGLRFDPIGPVSLKNVAEPVELFRASRRPG